MVTEAALRYRLCPTEVLLGQLDRLISLSQLSNMRFGVVSFDTPYTVPPVHGFWLLDDELVNIETFSAGLNLTQPPEIALYRKVFDSLAGVATYGRAARAIISRVADELAAQIGPEVSE